MIYNMITGDMFTFSIIYTIVMLGFSEAFFFLYKGHPDRENSLFGDYLTTWMALFQMTMGEFNVSDWLIIDSCLFRIGQFRFNAIDHLNMVFFYLNCSQGKYKT